MTNLVGRAGHARATTKGLVICANARQWTKVEEVARQATGESVTGTLRALLGRLLELIAFHSMTLSNEVLGGISEFHPLVDAERF